MYSFNYFIVQHLPQPLKQSKTNIIIPEMCLFVGDINQQEQVQPPAGDQVHDPLQQQEEDEEEEEGEEKENNAQEDQEEENNQVEEKHEEQPEQQMQVDPPNLNPDKVRVKAIPTSETHVTQSLVLHHLK